jgi:hypothetical protein
MPETPEILFYQAYSALALTLAGRKCECGALLVRDVARVSDENGHVSYYIFFDRAQNITCRTTDRDMAVMTCPLGCRALDHYIALRPRGLLPDGFKTKHFFRKISQTKGGKMSISWSAQNIGKGPLADVSKKGK